jgi:hypothetical protein
VSLAEDFVAFAEHRYQLDWRVVQGAVARRLRLTAAFDPALWDPLRAPTHWCVPILLGDYAGASRAAVLADVETYLTGCLVRHFCLASTIPAELSRAGETYRLLRDAYAGCGRDSLVNAPLEDRFAAKCRPWTVLLGLGTSAIRAELGETEAIREGLDGTVLVYSGLQVIDDWHDQGDDQLRDHWNLWADESVPQVLAAVAHLLDGAHLRVVGLRRHLLRRALEAQEEDVRRDLSGVLEQLTAVGGLRRA